MTGRALRWDRREGKRRESAALDVAKSTREGKRGGGGDQSRADVRRKPFIS